MTGGEFAICVAILAMVAIGVVIRTVVTTALAAPGNSSAVPPRESNARWERWKRLEAMTFLLWWLVLAAPLYLLYLGAGTLSLALLPDGAIVFTVSPRVWVPLALFTSPPLAAAANLLLAKRFLGPVAFARWRQADRKKAGRDPLKLGVALTLVLLTTAGTLLALALNHFCIADASGIRFSRLLHWREEFHSWDEVTELTCVVSHLSRRDRPVRDPYYRITFADGSSWSTRQLLLTGEKRKAERLAAYIQERAGLSAQIENPYPDAPPAEEPSDGGG